MKNEVKVSIIVPVYNAEPFLHRCIDSLVNQTYENIEIILVNDGSTDNSAYVCRSYQDKRIIVKEQQNSGQVVAKKTGRKIASGEYFTYVDADDYVELNYIEHIIEQMGTQRPDLVAFNLVEEYPDYSAEKRNHFQEGFYESESFREKILPEMISYGDFFSFGILPNAVCKLFHKKTYDELDIYVSSNVRFGEDADEVFQFLCAGPSILLLDFAPYHYVKRRESVSWQMVSEKAIIALQDDLRRAMIKSGCLELLDEQLEKYIRFVRCLKNPRSILGEKIKEGKAALYGAGGFGQALYFSYKQDISMWVDARWKQYCGMEMKIEDPKTLFSRSEEYDYIYIAILNIGLCKKIKNELIHNGITKPIYIALE